MLRRLTGLGVRWCHDGAVNLRVLVVDDDAALAEMLGIVLRGEGIEPVFCSDGAKAVEVFHQAKPDVVLLDVMLPGRSGGDIARMIRSESDVPIIMLTARTDTRDVVAGLEAGADDYVTKPFKPRELLARVKAQGRRVTGGGQEQLRIADLVIDQVGHSVTRGGALPGRGSKVTDLVTNPPRASRSMTSESSMPKPHVPTSVMPTPNISAPRLSDTNSSLPRA